MPEAHAIPTLDAHVTPRGLKVWCTHCGAYHHHGLVPGHRAAHCTDRASPYAAAGYMLRPTGRPAPSATEMRRRARAVQSPGKPRPREPLGADVPRRKTMLKSQTGREPIGLAQKLAKRVKPDGSVIKSVCPVCGQAVLYVMAHGRRSVHDLEGASHPCAAPPTAEDAGQRMTR